MSDNHFLQKMWLDKKNTQALLITIQIYCVMHMWQSCEPNKIQITKLTKNMHFCAQCILLVLYAQ